MDYDIPLLRSKIGSSYCITIIIIYTVYIQITGNKSRYLV